MGRILDSLRNNLFWVLMVLAVGAIACTHVFVTRRMASRVGDLRHEGSRVVENLRGLAGRSSIPNKKMIGVAGGQKTTLQLLYGRLFVMFAPKSGAFDRDFKAMKRGLSLDLAVHEWWKEYRVAAPELLARAKTHLRATDTAFEINPTPAVLPSDPKVIKADIEKNEGVFWRIEYTINALIYATANTKTEKTPLISKLQLVKLGGPARSKHPWVHGTNVEIRAEMAYENVGPLVAALQNSPEPLLVRSIRAALPGAGEAALATDDLSTTMNVILFCEIVEFQPAVKQVTFGGTLFKKSDNVKEWVKAQEQDLHIATVALLKRVPGLKARAEALLGATLEDAWRTEREARDRRLERIEAGAAARLANMIEKSKVKGKIVPARKKAAEKRHADLIAKEKEAAQKRYRRAELRITAKMGGFSLVYDHLRPIVAQKAYFVGLKNSPANVVIAKAPHSAKHGAGRWWMAQAKKDGKHWPTRGNKRWPVREIIEEIKAGTPGMVHIKVDSGSIDAPVLFANNDTGEMVQMLVAEPRGGWRTYAMVPADGKPVSLGDVAFRFAPVVSAVAPVIDTRAFKRASKRVTLLPKQVKSGITFTIPVPDGAGGTITVATGLR